MINTPEENVLQARHSHPRGQLTSPQQRRQVQLYGHIFMVHFEQRQFPELGSWIAGMI
jgi:hypothetical protein